MNERSFIFQNKKAKKMPTQPLLSSFKLGKLELSNRIVMAPLTRSRADNPENAPTELHAEYYSQRASAGLIITEATQVSKQGVGYINTPGIHSAAQIEGWKKVTKAVHEAGGKIFLQLWHVGYVSHPDFHNGELPVSASAINPNTKSFTPQGFKDTVESRALTIEEIKETIQDYRRGARNAIDAGMNGVEVHGANGYLIDQFIQDSTNLRTDEYGGSIENRSRFLFEILDEVIAELGDSTRVGLRLSPSGLFNTQGDSNSKNAWTYVIQKLNDYNLAYVHFVEPLVPLPEDTHFAKQVLDFYGKLYTGTKIINGGYDQDKGNKEIGEGNADLVAYGKPFISNPDLPKRFELNAPLAQWDQDTFYTPGPKGYTDYPALEA